MDFSSISIILLGSTFGLILRMLLQNNFKKNIGSDIQNTSIVNFLSSFLLGILVALNFINILSFKPKVVPIKIIHIELKSKT